VIDVVVEPVPASHDDLIGVANPRFTQYVRVSITDTGSGMDQATVERIFEPFFTTKPTGQGTGLGLSVVHGIMKGHEGTISVHSEPGRGSSFQLYFPEAKAPTESASAAPDGPPRSPQPGLGTGLRVLYVDDEEPLVVLAARWLVRLGHHVKGFSDSSLALEEFRAHPDDFDAVITDFSMPGLSGADLAREVLSIRPDIIVVMSSGYLRPEDQQLAKELGAVDLVLKPQGMAEFGRILHLILRSHGSGRTRA
jgi:CheY-like chemotaxis protein